MEDNPRARLKQWLASGEARLKPLTFPQRELWENSPVAPGDPANNIGSFFELKGNVTHQEIEIAIQKVVERQEVMRTSILPGKERPLQIIRSTGQAEVGFRELSAAELQPETLDAITAESIRRPFDLLNGPLYRMEILQRGPGDFFVVFTTHHSISDGWTLGVFIEDLCAAYIMKMRNSGKSLEHATGFSKSMEPVPMTYAEWGAAERARWTPEEIQTHADFWKQRLAGSQLLLDDMKSGAGQAGPLEKWVTSMSKEQVAAARELAKKNGARLFGTLLAAFQLTLYKWSGKDDITVGTPVANRSKAAVGQTMGSFAGIVPLRGQIDPKRPYADHLKAVHEDTMDSFAHAMPFAELAKAVDESPSPDRHTVFDTRFAFQNHPTPDIIIPGLSTRLQVWSTGTARFDIACEITEEDGSFEVVWLHRPSAVSAEEIRELDQLYRDVLKAVCHNPNITPDAMTV